MSENMAQSRGQGAQAPSGSAWSTGETELKVVQVDPLNSISASISDDFSHKDKVEVRQLSALQNSTQRLGHSPDLSQSSEPEKRAAKAKKTLGFFSGASKEEHRPPPRGARFPLPGASVDEEAKWWTTPTSLAPPIDQANFGIHERAAQEARIMHERRLMAAGQASEVGRRVNPNEHNKVSPANAQETESLKSVPQYNTYNQAAYTSGAQEIVSGSLSEGSHARPPKRRRSEQTSRTGILRDVENLDSHEVEELLKKLQERSRQLGFKQDSIQRPCKYLTLHRLEDSRGRSTHIQPLPPWPLQKPAQALYFDPPQLTRGQDGQGMLRSQLPMRNFDLYLEQNKDISFVVYKTFEMPQNTPSNQGTGSRVAFGHNLSDAKVHESIQPVNEALTNAVVALLETESGYESILEDFRDTSELVSPYLFVYHRRHEWDRIRRSHPESCHHQMTMLWDYIVQSHGVEYAAADTMIANSKISPGLLKYLFRPGQLLLQRRPEGMQGLVCIDWPEAIQPGEVPSRKPESTVQDKSKDPGSNRRWELRAWHWEFDGAFRRKKVTVTVSIGSGTNEQIGIPIDTLDIFPLEFASHEMIEQIQLRGKSFWECRKRALVSYKGADTNDDNLVSSANAHLGSWSGMRYKRL